MSDEANRRQVAMATAAQGRMDSLGTTAVRTGASSLSGQRGALRRALQRSETPEQLRHELLLLMQVARPTALANALAKTRTLAQLGGMLAVHEETEQD